MSEEKGFPARTQRLQLSTKRRKRGFWLTRKRLFSAWVNNVLLYGGCDLWRPPAPQTSGVTACSCGAAGGMC